MAFAAFASGTADPLDAPVRKRSTIALVLLLPGIAYMLLFFLAPLVSLVLTSFQVEIPDGDIGEYAPGFAWQNYLIVMADYWPHALRSFGYALIATVLALVISYPLAYFIGVKARPWPLLQNLLLTLVIAPFFISFLLRTLAWKQILADESPLVQALKAVAILPSDGHLTGTPFAVIFGITYNFIPFMTLPLYTTLERLDTRFLEAGSDLYAHPPRSSGRSPCRSRCPASSRGRC
ncbi:ABC transporter permease [Rathayibacter oskolensis]|uniref:ABC transporter permease n=1 Tax=Rathayibacter oskolensis TaxID=1891671 RepID=UPI00265E5952|nr:ABC transporter permease [Rathayibacter oskolensis]WKK73436.1 ABC transporter permease [Rathayibacter oskolensis]